MGLLGRPAVLVLVDHLHFPLKPSLRADEEDEDDEEDDGSFEPKQTDSRSSSWDSCSFSQNLN